MTRCIIIFLIMFLFQVWNVNIHSISYAQDQNIEYILNRCYDSTNGALKATVSGDAVMSNISADTVSLREQASAPGTPSSGDAMIYAKSSDSKIYYKNDAGTEYGISNVPAGASGNVQYNSSGWFAGDPEFNWEAVGNTLNVFGRISADNVSSDVVSADVIYLSEGATQATPVNGRGVFYVKSSDNKPYFKTTGGVEYGMTTATEVTNMKEGVINFVIGDGVNAINDSILSIDAAIPYNGTISKWEVKGDTNGSIQVDILKSTYGNAFSTIAGSEKPLLSTAMWNTDTNLTTWTTAISAGDWLKVSLDSVTTLKEATIAIYIDKT